MQEFKVVQRIGRRRRTYRPALPVLVPAWRNQSHVQRQSRPRFSFPKFSAIANRVYAARPRVGIALPYALSAALAAAFAVLLALFLADGRRALSRTAVPLDPLGVRAMQTYAGLHPATAGSTTLEAGDGELLDTVETFSWETYTVRNGDSISSIAANRALSMDSLIALNGVTNVKRLRVGSVLKIPNMDGIPYTVRKGDSLGRIAAAWGIPVTAILDANDLATETITAGQSLFLPGARMRSDELKKALGELFIYPIRGKLTSRFGWRNDPFTGARRFHAALDLAADTGTPVKAAQDGKVSAVGVSPVYGNYVIVTHSGGYQTMYAHLSAIRTAKGARVGQGERIGDVGSTGYSTGPHLHFGVYRNGRALDPLQFLGR